MAYAGYYRRNSGCIVIDEATIPFCAEVWVSAAIMDRDKDTYTVFHPLINRSPTLARLTAYADSTGLRLHGCGLDIKLPGSKRANYRVVLSLITPLLRLTGDGKAPYLSDFRAVIAETVGGAASEAYVSWFDRRLG